MDKKQAEEEVVKKAKEATHAAGKNTGMSGRDLASFFCCYDDDPTAHVHETQFTFNPEWFEDSEEEEADWDLEKYRRQKEEEDLATETQRIMDLESQMGNELSI